MRKLPPKAAYVLRQKQTRLHTCHWPGCDKQVPPAMWGCKTHWYQLPEHLRSQIWKAFVPGQEISRKPSAAYLSAARQVKAWIRKQELKNRVGSREVIVSFACNDPDNGFFRGRVTGCEWETNHDGRHNWSASFDHDDSLHGSAFRVDETLMIFRLHRIAFPYKRRIPWHGNWCWEGFVMKRPAALRLLHVLRREGKWHLAVAPSRVWSWQKKLDEKERNNG